MECHSIKKKLQFLFIITDNWLLRLLLQNRIVYVLCTLLNVILIVSKFVYKNNSNKKVHSADLTILIIRYHIYIPTGRREPQQKTGRKK